MQLNTIKCVILSYSIFAFIIAPVNNLKCYQCRSDRDKLCEDETELSEKYLNSCEVEEQSEYLDEVDENLPIEGEQESSAVEKHAFHDYARSKDRSEKDNETGIMNNEEINAKGKQFKCRKVTQKLYITDPVETIVFRECTTHFSEDDCNKSSNKLLYLAVCDCSEDGCNKVKKMETYFMGVKKYVMLLIVLLVLNFINT